MRSRGSLLVTFLVLRLVASEHPGRARPGTLNNEDSDNHRVRGRPGAEIPATSRQPVGKRLSPRGRGRQGKSAALGRPHVVVLIAVSTPPPEHPLLAVSVKTSRISMIRAPSRAHPGHPPRRASRPLQKRSPPGFARFTLGTRRAACALWIITSSTMNHRFGMKRIATFTQSR